MVGAGVPSLLLAVGTPVCLVALGGGHMASVAPLRPSFYICSKHPEESQGFFLGGRTYTQGKLGATASSSQICHLSCRQPYLGSLCLCQVCPIETLGALVFLSMM